MPSTDDRTIDTRAVVEKVMESWNAGDIPALMSFWSPEMVHHGRDGSVLTAAETGCINSVWCPTTYSR